MTRTNVFQDAISLLFDEKSVAYLMKELTLDESVRTNYQEQLT